MPRKPQDAGDHHPPLNAVDVVARPWAFTQDHPLGTSEISRELERRGVRVAAAVLRQLYKHADLVPFVEITNRRLAEPRLSHNDEPPSGGTRQTDLRLALRDGRLRDLAFEPFRARVPFRERGLGDRRGWWNGLLYSKYQLLAAPELRVRVRQLRYVRSAGHLRPVLPAVSQRTPTASARVRA